MKQGWGIKTVGAICDIKTGRLDANAASENGTYPFFTCSQIPLRIDNYAYDCECVLVAGNGELNAKYYNGKFNAYQRTYIITTKSEYKNISVKYLYKFFSKYIEQLRQLSIGGVIKYIKLGNLTDATLPIPPREEQERIVAELDCLSGIIERKREQLRELDALAQSIFYQMFGDPNTNDRNWNVVKLNTTCDNLDYQRRPITAKDRIDGDIPYYGASGVVDYVQDYIFDGDYLLVSEDGANLEVRHTPIAFSIKGKTWVNNHAHILKFEHYCTQVFMEYYINLLDISDIITGCAQPKLTQANLNCIDVFDISIEKQQEFADKIEAIEKQKELIKQSITQTEELFNSRMDYYFN